MKLSTRQKDLPFDRIAFNRAGFQNLFTRNFFRTQAFAVIVLSCVWLLMVLLVNPAGEFPLNDDWSYSQSVRSLIENGHLRLSGFTSMPLIAQVLWGALFCLPFGFSFTALRISTITAGLLGILATYKLSREAKADQTIGLFAAFIIAANPLYFHLSLTFMTDVPFFTFSMFAFLFLLRTLRTESILDLALGYVFCLIAILVRQLAFVIPLSFLVAYFFKNRVSLRVIGNALIPSTAFAGLLFALPTVLRRTVGLPALYNRAFEPILESASIGSLQLPLIFVNRLFIELIYIGLFLLPFTILRGANIQRGTSPKMRHLLGLTGCILFTAISGLLIWQGQAMPLIGNVFFDFGLGPALLRDTYLLGLPHWPTAPREVWFIVTAAAILGSVFLILGVLPVIKRMIWLFATESTVEEAEILFLLSAVVFYAVVIAITGFLDRYLIWPLPLLMAVLLVERRPVRLGAQVLPFSITAILLVIFGLFAVGGTHDYLAWNQARWQALTDLIDKVGISYENIDGGFEFNGWYAYHATYRIDPSKSPWWVKGDDYMISFGLMPYYVEMKRYPFERWIPPGQGDIFVLQRVDASHDGQAVKR